MPMLPPAPARLSTTTCWPSDSESFCAMMRAMTSVGPPGAKPTMMRIGFTGYCCAAAPPAAIIAAANIAAPAVMIFFIAFSSFFASWILNFSSSDQRPQRAQIRHLLDPPHGVDQLTRALRAEHRNAQLIRLSCDFLAVHRIVH